MPQAGGANHCTTFSYAVWNINHPCPFPDWTCNGNEASWVEIMRYPGKYWGGVQFIFRRLCLLAVLLYLKLYPVCAVLIAIYVCVGVCAHRRSVYHPVGSLLAVKHHTVRFLPLLRSPKNKKHTQWNPEHRNTFLIWKLSDVFESHTHSYLYCSLACITMKSHLWFIHLWRRLYCSWGH